jgi:hypothetical protein
MFDCEVLFDNLAGQYTCNILRLRAEGSEGERKTRDYL